MKVLLANGVKPHLDPVLFSQKSTSFSSAALMCVCAGAVSTRLCNLIGGIERDKGMLSCNGAEYDTGKLNYNFWCFFFKKKIFYVFSPVRFKIQHFWESDVFMTRRNIWKLAKTPNRFVPDRTSDDSEISTRICATNLDTFNSFVTACRVYIACDISIDLLMINFFVCRVDYLDSLSCPHPHIFTFWLFSSRKCDLF